jgi:prepilin-type N-terminal cleavage/methylation domain-containing protein
MKRPNRRRDPGRKAFTLLEILAVIFIIAIVTAVLLPTISNTRGHTSNRVKCGSNMR